MRKTCLKDKQYKCCEENLSKRQIVQMLWVKRASKTNSINVGSKTCLKDKQYKCWEWNMFRKQTVQMLCAKHVYKTNSTNVGSEHAETSNSTNVVSKTCLKDKQYKCCEENMFKRLTVQMLWVKHVKKMYKCWK